MSTIFKDVKKVEDLMLRVFNNKMIEADEEKEIIGDDEAIKALCSKVFGDGSTTPDPSTLHAFNNIVVRVADIVAKPDVEKLLTYFANYQTVPVETQLVEYKRPHPVGLKFKWSAVGSDVSLKRVEAGTIDFIKLGDIQTGISYNPLTRSETCVENFKALVNDVASAKVRLIYEQIMSLIEKNIQGSGEIPTSQVVSKGNSTLADLTKVANIIARRTGGRPIFVADRTLIDYYAENIGTTATTLLVDSVKDAMYNYELTNLRSCDAIPLDNKFIGDSEKTEFPTNVGYVLGGVSGSKKPFEVILGGGLVQYTENNFVHGEVKMIIRQRLGIDLLVGNAMGYIKETSITQA